MGNHLSRRPGRISDDARGEGVATVLISCRCNPSLVCHRKASGHGVTVRLWDEETAPGAARADPSGAELLPMILSKLDTKQAAVTSALSSAWRHAWKLSPRLTFDIFAMSCDGYKGERQYRAFLDRRRHVQRFIDAVNGILHQRLGDPVEQLELRLDVEALAQVGHHLDDWVRFAVSSQTKGLVLHVPPVTRFQAASYEQHVFPLQLLDAGGGTSSLQHVHLSYVSLKVPQSIRFPNLRKLGLYSALVPTNDLNRVLSNCSSLEWLDLCMVYLKDGLKVDRPLCRLKYLRLADCRVTKIQLNASKLTSFIFKESQGPMSTPAVPMPNINLGEASELHSVHIYCYKLTLERSRPIAPCFPWRPASTSRFSHLTHLHLFFTITDRHVSSILSIASILEAAPFLKELDADFAHGQCKYKCLERMRVRNFTGTKSQVGVMVHIVENAPALEVLIVDPIRLHAGYTGHVKAAALSAARRIAFKSINLRVWYWSQLQETTTFAARFAGNHQLVNPLQKTPENLLSRCKKH
ncbi:hypothetical protein VPH35_061496 [Triticum aestivum]